MLKIDMEDRPYEKYEKYGMKSLTNKDLLAILLRTGTKRYNVMQLASLLLSGGVKHQVQQGDTNLGKLYELTYEQLTELPGIGKVKALQILSFLELSKRVAKETKMPTKKFTKPSDIAECFMESLRYEQRECFMAVLLDAKCHLLSEHVISTGSLTSSIVHPREVFKVAIKWSAHSIIVLHNHPSGDPTPSSEDIQITKRLKEVGALIGIPLLDHVIIGYGTYCSLKEESYI